MATDPVLELILGQFATELRTIAAPTHSQTVGSNVHRRWPNEALLTEPQPAIYLFSGTERKMLTGTQGDAIGLGVPIGIQGSLLELEVVFLAKCTPATREQVGRRFAADIESVLVQPDRVIGGSVVRVEASECDLYVQDQYEDQAGGHAQFLVYHEYALGDPRSGVAG